MKAAIRLTLILVTVGCLVPADALSEKDAKLLGLTSSERQPLPFPHKAAQQMFERAYKCQQKLQTDRAIGLYREALRVDSTLFEAHYNMGLCLEARAKWEAAKSAFKAAAAIYPKEPTCYKHLAIICNKQANEEEARMWLQRYLSLQPGAVH